jgi:hypothetical protein
VQLHWRRNQNLSSRCPLMHMRPITTSSIRNSTSHHLRPLLPKHSRPSSRRTGTRLIIPCNRLIQLTSHPDRQTSTCRCPHKRICHHRKVTQSLGELELPLHTRCHHQEEDFLKWKVHNRYRRRGKDSPKWQQGNNSMNRRGARRKSCMRRD